ncbi:MAG: hypothetical protein Alis3KO_14980 [Aliiglaciecola sp.]|uniref:hypothetical protein n=1 Tax=Aliiglaciecola sp. M165 TaxID=2593649 RepID=UPI00118039D6|nr:hypothetical protein [Aliiglaciecola sp. M165]TRY31548.1 hypothetical protein FM019_11815 [Aliiglaciecola sp. M165]
MNIFDVFKDKVSSLLNDSEQSVSERLIELATFFYKVDRRVSLEEQKYIDELLETIEWDSVISAESFQRSCILKINGMIGCSEDQILLYLSNLMQEISELGAVAKAQTLAKEISDSDGEIADDEVKYLDLVMSFK